MKSSRALEHDPAERFGIGRRFDSAADLVTSDEVEVVFVTTWTGAHRELTELCCQAGKPVFCEKPLALDLAATDDAAEGITTGISVTDRARTIEVAVDENAGPKDLARPGHVFPLRARPGPEAASRLSGKASIRTPVISGRSVLAVIV